MNFLPMDGQAMFYIFIGFLIGIASIIIFHSSIAAKIGALEEKLLNEFQKTKTTTPNQTTTIIPGQGS